MYWSSSSGRIELKIIKSHAINCSHPGPCDNDVKQLSDRPYIKKQIAKIAPDTLAGELKEYGAWDSEELKDHNQNIQRLLWLASGDIADGQN